MEISAHNEIAGRLGSAWESLRRCKLCPRSCGIDRTQGQRGFCGLGWQSYCFREMVYNHEETPLNPSHQVYFTGCNLRCDFCSVSEWNREPVQAKYLISPDSIAQAVTQKHAAGAKTLNLLGGEPTVNVYGILTLLKKLHPDITVVWNSNMYYNQLTRELIDGLVDIYLADFKCGNVACAAGLLGVEDYTDVVKENILQAAADKTTIVRHVLMPGHFDCCTKPILKWLGESVPQVSVSIKGDYVPPAGTDVSPVGYTTQAEFLEAVSVGKSLGLKLMN